MLEFLKRLGRCTPVVMLFDDLHWADESSIALLEHLAPHDQKMPILMVATFRDVETDMGEPFKRALTALSLIDEGQREARADLLHRRGSVRRSLGQLEDFLADLRAAFDVFETLGLGEKAAPIADEMSTILSWLARNDEGQALVSRGISLIPDEQSESYCRLLSAKGVLSSNAGQAASALRSHQTAVAIARRLDSPVLLARVLQNQAWEGWHRFDGVAAQRVAHEAEAILRDLGQEWNLSQSLVVEQAGLTLTGRYDEARAAFDSAAARALPPSAWSGTDVAKALSGKTALGDPKTYSYFESLREQVPAEGQIMASGAVVLLLATIEALVLIGRDDEAALHYPAVRAFVASGCGVQTFTYGLTERFAGMAAAAARN